MGRLGDPFGFETDGLQLTTGNGRASIMNTGPAQQLRLVALFVTAGVLLSACSEPPAPSATSHQEAPEAAVGFVNIVWEVSQSSSVMPGTLYVFLSDGTLVVTAPDIKPTLGTWRDDAGVLTMVEQGLPYQVDVLSLSRDEFNIRSHNPGQPAEMTLIPAERPGR